MIFDQLWKAQRERSKLKRTFDRLISQAEKEKNDKKAASLIGEFQMEGRFIDDKINVLRSTRLREEAERLGIPTPPLSDEESWEYGCQKDLIFLGVKAQSQLRGEIRKERRERWEDRTLWITRILIPLLGLTIGLIGTLTALVSVWRK
ncbi:MAG: hypothetical protein HYS38_03490 [Acidobacteria bacterium]|nr:hypothetical protein [Acidobacteriota bacterium]